jgi:hypothetical protein
VCSYDLHGGPCPHSQLAFAFAAGRRVGCAGPYAVRTAAASAGTVFTRPRRFALSEPGDPPDFVILIFGSDGAECLTAAFLVDTTKQVPRGLLAYGGVRVVFETDQQGLQGAEIAVAPVHDLSQLRLRPLCFFCLVIEPWPPGNLREGPRPPDSGLEARPGQLEVLSQQRQFAAGRQV